MTGPGPEPILLDTNLLVYAFRAERPEHARAREWLLPRLEGDAEVGLNSAVLSGFVRVITHPRVFERPSPVAEAVAFIEALRAAPAAAAVEPGDDYPALFAEICRSLGLGGNDVPDAHLAAVAIESGSVLATHDRGFARFTGLRTTDPLA